MRRLIAEIGSCNGDLQYALDAVDAFAEAGVWAVKGQLYTADSLVTQDAKTYGVGLHEPATQYEAFSNTLTRNEWDDVGARCIEKDVHFFGSVFDSEAVEQGLWQGWDYVKIASADITHHALLEEVAEHDWHVILSTGAATVAEIARATNLFKHRLTVMACTLAYPCPLAEAHVDRIDTLKEMYPRDSVGYSDHTRGIAAADYAFRVGADFVEKHVTLTPGMGGDHDFAVTPDQVKTLVDGDVYRSIVGDSLVAGDPGLYPRDCEQAARGLARRSPYMTADVSAGEVVDEQNTQMLRPAVGVSGFELPAVAAVDLWRGHVVTDGLITNS